MSTDNDDEESEIDDDDDDEGDESEESQNKLKDDELQDHSLAPQQKQLVSEFKWCGKISTIDSWSGGRDAAGYAHGSGLLTTYYTVEQSADSGPWLWTFQCTLHHGLVRGYFLVNLNGQFTAARCDVDGVFDGDFIIFKASDSEFSCLISKFHKGTEVGPQVRS